MKRFVMAATAAVLMAGSAHATSYAFSTDYNGSVIFSGTFTFDQTTLTAFDADLGLKHFDFASVFTGSGKIGGSSHAVASSVGSNFGGSASDNDFLIYFSPSSPDFSPLTMYTTNTTGQKTILLSLASIPDPMSPVNPPTRAVPEPATWMMFIGGFGLIGAGMRRRQRVGIRFA